MAFQVLRAYRPTIYLWALALIFILLPSLAVALVIGGLVGLGLFIGLLTYRFRNQSSNQSPYAFERTLFEQGAPTWRNISVTFFGPSGR